LHEKIRKEEVEEIQPVIHRERERTEVHQVTQPIYESETRALSIHEQMLPAETKETVRESLSADFMEQYKVNDQSTSEFTGTERVKIEKPAIIVESEKRRIVEEVQPIIYKEIVEPHVFKTTLPIYEKIVEAPTIVKEVLPARTVGEAKHFQFHDTSSLASGKPSYTHPAPKSYTYSTTGPSSTGYQSTTYTASEQQGTSFKSIPIQESRWKQHDDVPNIRTK